MVLVVSSAVALQLIGITPASAVTGIKKITVASPTDSQSPKTATAFCPTGKRVIGGGGWVFAVNAADGNKVALTGLQPIHPIVAGLDDRYEATGAETGAGIVTNWSLQVYAICADASGLPGYEIRYAATQPSSNSVQAAQAVCLGGTRVLGTGGKIATASNQNPAGQVVLQVARASATGDIARVQAHEDADGYNGTWFVQSYAVCVNPPSGYEVVQAASPQTASESEKLAYADCPGTKRVHGAGAAIANTAPGNVSLQVIYPFEDLKTVEAFAVENTATSADWDFIVAQAICAY
ncbi:hypothetical protein ACQPZX_21535 [Actinoplanes sp. CA-142083]|uniref:hypothetical protein n=1 Tax=Actinoplanes sp. CA-142083 TaxID=3239903 RepID=UPI003D94018A